MQSRAPGLRNRKCIPPGLVRHRQGASLGEAMREALLPNTAFGFPVLIDLSDHIFWRQTFCEATPLERRALDQETGHAIRVAESGCKRIEQTRRPGATVREVDI